MNTPPHERPTFPPPPLAKASRPGFGARVALFRLAAVGLAVLMAGCRPAKGSASAAAASRVHSRSELSKQLDILISAVDNGEFGELRRQLSPRAAGQLSSQSLARASRDLRQSHGASIGILEEQSQPEAGLHWYSALVLYADGRGRRARRRAKPVVYQFAVDSSGQIDHLRIREHRLLDTVRPPAETYVPVTRFHMPAPGTWYVLHGGRTLDTNYHHKNRNQRFAFDLIVKKRGRSAPARSNKNRNESFYAHGRPLLAPAAGVVVRAVNDVPENTPPKPGRKGGNGVIIDHGFGEFSALWHAIPGSVSVDVGDRVEVGQQIGTVGNSGHSTTPHIHFHVSYRRFGMEQFGLPAQLVETFVDDTWQVTSMPVRGQYVRRASDPRGDPPPGDDPKTGSGRAAAPATKQRQASGDGPRVFLAL